MRQKSKVSLPPRKESFASPSSQSHGNKPQSNQIFGNHFADKQNAQSIDKRIDTSHGFASQYDHSQTSPPMLNTVSGGIDYDRYCSPSGGIDPEERGPSPSGGLDPNERGLSPSGGIEGIDQPVLPKLAEICIDCKDHAETISQHLRVTLPKIIQSFKVTQDAFKILVRNLGCPVAPASACYDIAISTSLLERIISLYTAKDEARKQIRPLAAMLSVRRIANEVEDIRNKDILEPSLTKAIEALEHLITTLSTDSQHMRR